MTKKEQDSMTIKDDLREMKDTLKKMQEDIELISNNAVINGQAEVWVQTGNVGRNGKAIVAVSNCGRIKRKNGTIEFSTLRQRIWYKGKQTHIYRILCEHFIERTAEDLRLNRNCVDHITHHPKGMNINDVRNLRWCTHRENMNFDERRRNLSKAASKALLNNPRVSKAQLNRPKSVFGQLYFKKYGYSRKQDIKQYNSEARHYYKYGKLRP